MAINEQLLKRIDGLKLSERAARLRQQYFTSKPGIAAERVKVVKESWDAFVGDDINVHRAKVVKRVLEEVPVIIWPGQLLAGNETKYFRGAYPHLDYDSAYLGALMSEEKGTMTLGGPVEKGVVSAEDWGILLGSATFFNGKAPTVRVKEVISSVMGSWYEDLIKAGCTRYEASGPYFGVPYYGKVVNNGLGSFVKEIEERIQGWVGSQEHDVGRLYFWQGTKIAVQALMHFAKRNACRAKEMAALEQDAAWRTELDEMAVACEWVSENPARTFREALQSILLMHMGLKLETPNGMPTGWDRPDQYLYPYFKRDLEEGRLTLEKAADLISDWLLYSVRLEWVKEISWRDYMQKGVLTSACLGGVDEEGSDVSNELSYLILHMMGLVGYCEPHLVIQWHKGTPRWLMLKAIETNWKVGGGVPQFQNGDHVVGLMVEKGVSLKEARNWTSHGCSQAVPNDQRCGLHPSYLNIPLCIDLALHNGIASKTGKRLGVTTGDPRNFKSFEEFNEAFRKQAEYVIRRQLWHDCLVDQIKGDFHRRPLASAFAPGCLEKGLDFNVGGLPHYRICMKKDRGLVPTADSLTAIKKLVYDENKLTMDELLLSLDTNFEGEKGEEVRQMCLAAPKYGNDIDGADEMLHDVAKFTASVISSIDNIFGYPFAINRNGQAWHFMAGKALAALPTGRRAGEPLPDGSLSAMQGKDVKGPTALLNSALKADFKESIAGVITLRLPRHLLNKEEIRDVVVSLTDAFMRDGGTYLQYNILDAKELREARVHPEKYRDLLVRVGGYSAYFVTLSPEVQDSIIACNEQSVPTEPDDKSDQVMVPC